MLLLQTGPVIRFQILRKVLNGLMLLKLEWHVSHLIPFSQISDVLSEKQQQELSAESYVWDLVAMMKGVVAAAVFALTTFPIVVEIIKVHGVFDFNFVFLVDAVVNSLSGVLSQMFTQLELSP